MRIREPQLETLLGYVLQRLKFRGLRDRSYRSKRSNSCFCSGRPLRLHSYKELGSRDKPPNMGLHDLSHLCSLRPKTCRIASKLML